MKICLVTETFPPEINGVAMTLRHLVEGLAGRGHEVTVFRPRQSDLDRGEQNGSFREVLFRGLPIPGYSMLKLGLPAARGMRRLWNVARPDLVHIATEGPLGLSALRAAKLLGIPLSSTFHTNFHSYSKHYGFPFLARLALAYLRYFHNRTQVTLSPTAELNAALTADGFQNTRLLGRGVNTSSFDPVHRRESLRHRYGVKQGDLLVVHVSRLAAEKNYPLLFRAFEVIRAKHPSSQLVIVSDGPLRNRLEKRYGYAHFTGFLPRDEMAAHYASGDLFLYPSLTETFGNVVTEAMASGLPVVAFNYAAAGKYMRHRENGWLVDFADEAGFVHGALTLASDSALRRTLGASARATAEGISWTRVIDAFERELSLVFQNVPIPAAPQPSQA